MAGVVPDRLRTLPGRVDAWLQPLRSTLPWRAYARYAAVRGNVLAGGVAYFAFFSLFPALALGFTAFALVLGNAEDLQTRIVQYVNESLGVTVISYHEGQQGMVTIEQLVKPEVLTTTGVIGAVTLLFTGLGWISALRDGVEAVFGARDATNPVVLKLLDVALLAAAGLAVLASVVVSVAVTLATDQVLRLLSLDGHSRTATVLTVAGQLVLALVDAAIFTLLFHRLAGVEVPLRDCATGGLLAGAGFTLLKLFAGALLGSTARNPFLAASGLVVGLLLWMNVLARLVLVAAAWSATVATDRGHLHTPDPVLLTATGTPPVPAPAVEPSATTGQAAPGGRPKRREARLLLLAGFAAGTVTGRLVSAARSRSRGRRPRGPARRG